MRAAKEIGAVRPVLAGVAGAVSVASFAFVMRTTIDVFTNAPASAGSAMAVWLFFAGLIGIMDGRAKEGTPGVTVSAILCPAAAAATAAAPFLAAKASAFGALAVFPAAAGPAGLACGLLLCRTWAGWSRIGSAGSSYAAGAVGAVLGGAACLLAGLLWRGPSSPVTAAAAPLGGLVRALSEIGTDGWLMPGAGITAAILAVAFGGGRSAGRSVGLAVFLGGCAQGALALALAPAAWTEFRDPAFGMTAVVLGAQGGGLALGAWATGKIKIPALWVLAPLHGVLCLVLGATPPVLGGLFDPATQPILATAGRWIAAAAAGALGGLHFGLSSRCSSGSLVPDRQASGLYGLALAGGVAALLVSALVLFPAFGGAGSLKALALCSAAAPAALLSALNRRADAGRR